jgi:hypothetical protein
MNSGPTLFPEDGYPDGSVHNCGVLWPRIFHPFDVQNRPNWRSEDCGLYESNHTRFIHIEKYWIAHSVANPNELAGLVDVEPSANVDDHRVYYDLTTVIIETAGSREYCHSGKPYKGSVAGWGVYFGPRNPLNQTGILPHPYYDLRKDKSSKSCHQGRIQSKQRAQIWAVFRALLTALKYFIPTTDRVWHVRPRQLIITTHCELVEDAFYLELKDCCTKGWRKDRWPSQKKGKRDYYRVFEFMFSMMRQLERAGILVQFWRTEDLDETGNAIKAAEQRIKKQAKFVQELYNALLATWEYIADTVRHLEDGGSESDQTRENLGDDKNDANAEDLKAAGSPKGYEQPVDDARDFGHTRSRRKRKSDFLGEDDIEEANQGSTTAGARKQRRD